MKRLLPMFMLLVLCLPSALAQNSRAKAQTQRTGNRVISGVVLNASTGQAVTDAVMSLTDSNGGPFQSETTTDTEGRFVFAGLYDGKFSLRAAHRGFVASGFEEHEGFFTGIVTGDGQETTGLKFMLEPQAVISGSVIDDAGDPVAQANVQLFRQDDRSGKEEIVHLNSVMTDDLGHYEIARLAAGTYFLAVTGTPWYATHAHLRFSDVEQSYAKTPLDVAFPMTFYDGAMSSDEATPIPVKASDRIAVNFTLQAQPALRITVQVPKPSAHQGMVVPQLRNKIFGNLEPTLQQMPFSTGQDEPGSTNTITVEIGGVPPGSYELEMPKGSNGTEGVTQVDASSGSVTVDTSHLESLADVDGRVAMEDGSNVPARVVFQLVPEGGEAKTAGVHNEGSFTLRGVAAGTYQVSAFGPKGEFAIKQLATTGGTTDGSSVKIGSTPVMLAAVLAESNTRVRGFAKLSGKPAPGAMIVLIPSNGNRETFRRDQSDSDGSFELKQVLPGHYTLVAIEDGWTLEWARSEVMQRYAAHGLKVTVALHGENIDLKDAVQTQPR